MVLFFVIEGVVFWSKNLNLVFLILQAFGGSNLLVLE